MQSHESRHFASEHLPDLHPDYSPPTVKGVIPDEIAVAYGHRTIPKLVDVLNLDELPDAERGHCLRVFCSLLANQEMKAKAISYGACRSLIIHMQSKDLEVVKLSCQAVESICKVLAGRQSVVQNDGIKTLTDTLTVAPVEATGAFKQLCSALDGRCAVLQSAALVIPALASLLNKEDTTLLTSLYGVETLAHLTSMEVGVCASLEAKVPECIVKVINRALAAGTEAEEAQTAEHVKEACAECFQQMSRHEYGKVSILENGGVKALGKLISDKSASCLKKATSALMGVSIDSEAKIPIMNSCGEHLLAALKHSDQEIAENARATVSNCCEKQEVSRIVREALSEVEREFFLGPLPRFAKEKC